MKLKPSLFKLLLRMGAKVKTTEGCHKGSNKKGVKEKKGSLKEDFLKELNKAISSSAVPILPVFPTGVLKPPVPFKFEPEVKLKHRANIRSKVSGIRFEIPSVPPQLKLESKDHMNRAIKVAELASAGLNGRRVFHVPHLHQHEKHLRVALGEKGESGKEESDFKPDHVKMKLVASNFQMEPQKAKKRESKVSKKQEIPEKELVLSKDTEKLELSRKKLDTHKEVGKRKGILKAEYNLCKNEGKRGKSGKTKRLEESEKLDVNVKKVVEKKGTERRKVESKDAIKIKVLKEEHRYPYQHRHEVQQNQHDPQTCDLSEKVSSSRLSRPLHLADNSSNGDTGPFYNNGEGKENGSEGLPKGENVISGGKLKDQSAVGGETTVRSFLKKLEFNLKEGKREATVELHPPELGKVKFSITLHDGKATARFWLPSPEVKALFENNMHHLHSFFKEQGYSLEASFFYSGGMGSGGEREERLGESSFSKKRSFLVVDEGDSLSEGEMLCSTEVAKEGLLNILA